MSKAIHALGWLLWDLKWCLNLVLNNVILDFNTFYHFALLSLFVLIVDLPSPGVLAMGLFGISAWSTPCFDYGCTQILRRPLELCASIQLHCSFRVTWITYLFSHPLRALIFQWNVARLSLESSWHLIFVLKCLSLLVWLFYILGTHFHSKLVFSINMDPYDHVILKSLFLLDFLGFRSYNHDLRYFYKLFMNLCIWIQQHPLNLTGLPRCYPWKM